MRGEGRFTIAILHGHPWTDDYGVEIAPEASAAVADAVAHLSAIGHGIEEHTLDHDGGYPELFRAIWRASAAMIPIADERVDELEPVTAWLVRDGRAMGARMLGEVLQGLTAFERRIITQFSPYDAVLTPALGQTPQPVGSHDSADPDENFAQQVRYSPLTSFVNVAGLPAIVLPVSTTADGLPMGVQLIGRPGGEATLLSIGAQLERRIRWQDRVPPIAAG